MGVFDIVDGFSVPLFKEGQILWNITFSIVFFLGTLSILISATKSTNTGLKSDV
jgi:hypothetical protein